MRDIIKSIFKKLLINTTNTLPILNNGPYILAFHGVTDNKNPVLNKNLHLDIDLFIEIINFFNKILIYPISMNLLKVIFLSKKINCI